MRVEGHRHDHGKARRGAADALERGVALLDRGQGLDPEQVDTAARERGGLLGEDLDGILKRERPERLEDLARRPDVAGDEGLPAALLDLGLRASTAAVRLSSGTRSRSCIARRERLPPNVLVSTICDPASR